MFEIYRIDVRGLETNSLDPSLIAILVNQLPPNARVRQVLDPRAAYSVTDVLLNNLEFEIRLWLYSHTEDAKRNINQPTPVIDFDKIGKEKPKDPNYQWKDIDAMADLMREINGM